MSSTPAASAKSVQLQDITAGSESGKPLFPGNLEMIQGLKVGLSVSPCHRRVKLLEERGVITRYMTLVDQKSLGLHVSVKPVKATGM